MALSTKTWSANDILTAADLNTYVRDSMLALSTWSSYTPTLTQSGAVTKTVTYAKYISAGKLVQVCMKLTVTGSGSAGNSILVGLPVTAATTGLAIGSGIVGDASVSSYPCIARISTTTTVELVRTDNTPVTGLIGADPNFALANTDTIILSMTYEAA